MPAGDVVATRRHHNVVGKNLTLAREQPITRPVVDQPLNGDSLPQLGSNKTGKALQVGDDLRFHHEPFRVRSVVREIGQVTLPVRGHQAERIPPLLVPGVANSVFL